jgi:hypothetical protein
MKTYFCLTSLTMFRNCPQYLLLMALERIRRTLFTAVQFQIHEFRGHCFYLAQSPPTGEQTAAENKRKKLDELSSLETVP